MVCEVHSELESDGEYQGGEEDASMTSHSSLLSRPTDDAVDDVTVLFGSVDGMVNETVESGQSRTIPLFNLLPWTKSRRSNRNSV